MNIRFKSIKEQKQPTTLRNRECCICNKIIYKKEKYNFICFRYDKTLISLYTHLNCKLKI